MSGFTPGDVIINSCTMSSPRGSLDMTAGFLSGRVYENIEVQNNIGEIDVFDTDDALGNLQVVGDETVTFSFNAPGTPVLNYIFGLDTVELTSITGTQKGKQYTLHCVGKETFYSKTNYVEKAYKTDISSIVKDIHSNFLNSINNLITEVTDGVQQLIIPKMRPFDAIDMVRRRATSSENPSSTFLYFENADGHNFKTIEGMLKQGVVKSFVHGDGIGSSIYINTYNNIIDYEVPRIISALDRIAMGGLNQKVATFDIRTRQYTSNTFQPNLGGFTSNLFQTLYGAAEGLFHMIPVDSKVNQTHIPQTTAQQMAYLANLLQCYINIKVPGDTTVKAGDMVEVNVPQALTTTGTQPNDPLISNNYLVSKLCRNIGTIEEKPRYTENMTCIVDNRSS